MNSGNRYGYDYVGYFKNPTDYYRAHGRAPCGTSFSQTMTIKCGSTNVIYKTNTLQATIDELTISVSRDGASQTRAY